MTNDELPPLPAGTHGSLVDDWQRIFTADQMREYARLAVAIRDDSEADQMLIAFEHGKKMAREQHAALVLPYLRTLSGFGGTLEQARALAARAVAEVEAEVKS